VRFELWPSHTTVEHANYTRPLQHNPHHGNTAVYTHTHTRTHNHLTAFCLGLPGYAGTRKNIHPLTSILIIGHPLSPSSIYNDLWHPCNTPVYITEYQTGKRIRGSRHDCGVSLLAAPCDSGKTHGAQYTASRSSSPSYAMEGKTPLCLYHTPNTRTQFTG